MYLNPKQGFTNIDRVVLTIAGKEYEATNVTALKLFAGDELLLDVPKNVQFVSSEVYRSGEKTLACGYFINTKGTSNCYMVTPCSAVGFNVMERKAYFSTQNATPGSVKVLWQTGINHGWRAPATAPINSYVDNRGAKGIYDPCPLGYRIAAHGAYNGFPANSWPQYDKSGGTSWFGVWWLKHLRALCARVACLLVPIGNTKKELRIIEFSTLLH